MSNSVFLIGMFVVLVIGLLTGHQLAFVLGGIGTIFGYFGSKSSSKKCSINIPTANRIV